MFIGFTTLTFVWGFGWQVQNLEALTDIAETMEHVFNAKERAIKQALWTVFQAVCLGMGFIYFVVAYKDPLRSSLQPT